LTYIFATYFKTVISYFIMAAFTFKNPIDQTCQMRSI